MSQSNIHATSASTRNRILWLKAFTHLSEDDKAQFSPSQAPSRTVLSDLATLVEERKKLCIQKRWKFTNTRGEKVILRDVFEKISLYIKKFAEVIDIVVQYDPVHAALPWAGVRLLLMISINGTQVYGAMIEGLELVGRIIARSAVVESIYLQKPSLVTNQLCDGLEKLYVSILQYLAKASRYYAQRAGGRILGLLNITAEKDISTQIDLIVKRDEEIKPLLQIIEREAQQRILDASTAGRLQIDALGDQTDNLQLDLSNKLTSLNLEVGQLAVQVSNSEDKLEQRLSRVLDELERPLIRLTSYLITYEDCLTKEQRVDVLHWLSTIPHRKHHLNMIKDIIPGSGRWLMSNDTYHGWWNSSVSSTLWLHGIPGCGKSKLVAHVVQAFLNERRLLNSSAPFAFFYCARAAAEPKRADPSEIMRSILRQLVGFSSDDPLKPAVIDVYSTRKHEAEDDGSDIDLLTIDECVGLILEITNETSATIIIDALDECNATTRYQLINALQKIVQQSANVVKIFISSREDGDIVMRMKDVINVLISASENSKDIQLFTEVEIDKAIEEKRLLGGVVDDGLRGQIKSSLLEGAHGMFQWVNLVIQNLCEFQRLQLAEDVPAEIARLPSGLADLYRLALLQIYGKGPKAKSAAISALRWLLRAQLPLSSSEFTRAVARETGTQLSPEGILTLCSNLVVIDTELNVFRLAHLSVREYLEYQSDFCATVSEPTIALQCLHICTDYIQQLKHSSLAISDQITYDQYASLYWPVHCSLVNGPLPTILLNTLETFLGINEIDWPQFKQWMAITSKFPTRFVTPDMKRRVKMSFSPSCHPIFLAIAFEFVDLVAIIMRTHQLNRELLNQFGLSPLALACNIGNLRIARILVESGAEVDIEDNVQSWRAKDGNMPPNPITAAVYHGRWAIMRLLLAAGADLNLASSNGSYEPPLVIAVRYGLDWLVEELIEAGADVNVSFGIYTPIQEAANTGQTRICRILLDHKANPTLEGARKAGFDGGALELAAAAGHLDVVKLIIEAGVPVDKNCLRWGTPLARAAWGKHCVIAEYLLQQHADPDIDCGPYGTPFLAAVAGGDIKIVTTFLKHGVNINHKGIGKGNALVIAAHRSHEEIFALLLEKGADPEAEVQYYGKTWPTAHLVAREGSLAMLRAIVRSYESSNRGKKLNDLLIIVISVNTNKECQSLVEWLIEIGADPNEQSEDGTRPIHVAVSQREVSILQVLLEKGARIDVVCNVHGSPLQALYLYSYQGWGLSNERLDRAETDIFDLLVSQGVDLNARGGLLGTALQAASHLGHFEHVKHMLNLGATIVEQDGYFGSPFNAAVSMGRLLVVEQFLQIGTNVNAACGPYGTTLQAAACHGRRPASLLLEPWQDDGPSSYFDPRNPTAYLNFLVKRDITSYRQIFELLLKLDVDIHAEGGIYGSAMQAAAYSGQIDMLKRLLDSGADVHVKSGFYGSCLQAACCAESRRWWDIFTDWSDSDDSVIFAEDKTAPQEFDFHIAIVELLLDKGVDVDYKGGYFGTALQAAVHSDEPKTVQLLLSAGARVTEDGDGFYGGCISAAISFGKRTMQGMDETIGYETNAAQILELLLDHTTSQDFPAMATSAIARAREKNNDEGLEVLKTAISQHSAYHGLVGKLFS